jgi:hypothetical protein
VIDKTGALECARTQAWALSLLTLAAEAFAPDWVAAGSARFRAGRGVFDPHAVLLDGDAPLLAVDILHTRPTATQRAARVQQAIQAGCVEYWRIEGTRRTPLFYQRGADGRMSRIPPDAEGIHFGMVFEELRFPAMWVTTRPSLLEMMSYWELIS